MALIKCPECGKEVSNQAETCIHCGYPLLKDKSVIKVDNKIYDISELKKIFYKYSSEDQKRIYKICKQNYQTCKKHATTIDSVPRYDAKVGTNIIQYIGRTFNWWNNNGKMHLTYKLIVECINHNFEYFEFNTADYQSVAPTPQPSAPTNQVRCPKCGSTSITTEEQGYGLFGWIGASQKKNLCQKCGYKWWPGR